MVLILSKEQTAVNATTHNAENVTCGVPPGSCLGPLLFPLYINDLSRSRITLYADDTSLAHCTKDIKDITRAMNTELENLKVWFYGNKLSLNVAKNNINAHRHKAYFKLQSNCRTCKSKF